VAAEIQRFIIDNELGAGDRLGTEDALAERFGISRPTLREALRLLASGNLIRASKGPGGGIFVARTIREGMGRSMSMSIAAMLEANAITVEELLDARLTLEVRLAGLAAQRATDDDLREIAEAVDEARANVEQGVDLLDSDARFHRAIAASSGNRLNLTFTEWVFEVFQPKLIKIVKPVVDNAQIVAQHQAISDAITARDVSRSERAMEEHLSYLGELVQRAENLEQKQARKPRAKPRGARS
jgi:DNA-binding FadR family transcriptional regulator